MDTSLAMLKLLASLRFSMFSPPNYLRARPGDCMLYLSSLIKAEAGSDLDGGSASTIGS
jgi:hypothetical protein